MRVFIYGATLRANEPDQLGLINVRTLAGYVVTDSRGDAERHLAEKLLREHPGAAVWGLQMMEVNPDHPPVAAPAFADADTLRALIANDSYAASFQRMGDYRRALLKAQPPLETKETAMSDIDARRLEQLKKYAQWDRENCVDDRQRLLTLDWAVAEIERLRTDRDYHAHELSRVITVLGIEGEDDPAAEILTLKRELRQAQERISATGKERTHGR
jgi:hypothetical protein